MSGAKLPTRLFAATGTNAFVGQDWESHSFLRLAGTREVGHITRNRTFLCIDWKWLRALDSGS